MTGRQPPLAEPDPPQGAPPPRVARFLEGDLWGTVRKTILALPQETPRQRAVYARTHWLFRLMSPGRPAHSEVVGNGIGDFFMRSDPNSGDQRWWLQATGKKRLIPATAELMVELMSYRRSLELSDLPQASEPSPLVFPVTWRRSTHPAPAWRYPDPQRHPWHPEGDLRARRSEVAQQWSWRRPGCEARSGVANWLRHTAGSSMSNQIDLEHVRDTLGHVSIATTSIYVHGEGDARHDAVSGTHRMSWDAVGSAPRI